MPLDLIVVELVLPIRSDVGGEAVAVEKARVLGLLSKTVVEPVPVIHLNTGEEAALGPLNEGFTVCY